MDFAGSLNLTLAWRKTKRDYSHYMNSFISSPYIIRVLEHKKEDWLEDLRETLECGEFDPRSPRIIDVPKRDYHLRPASVLHPEDLVVYSALILEVFDELRSSIEWSAGECRYSHILREDIEDSNQWDEFEKPYWKEMQEKKIDLAEENEYVLETDVSGFYENIDIERVTSIFKQFTDRQDVGNEIRHLIRPWADPRKRGVPQGYGPSDILAEIYLDGVDRRLKNNGFDHVRYNDDFVIFCDSRDAAIEAQNLLEREFRIRGLNMKSGKTEIMPSIDALQAYAEPEATFEQIKEELGDQEADDSDEVEDTETTDRSLAEAAAEYARTVSGGTIPYGTESEDRETVSDGGLPPEEDDSAETADDSDDEITEEQREYLQEAYSRHIQDKEFKDVDTHIFRYIINRLGKAEDTIAIDYCIDYIKDGQADVRRILYNYFKYLPNKDEVAARMASAVANQELRYNYHNFLILRWLFEEEFNSTEVIHCARQVIGRRNELVESREYATAILSEYGDYSDWERIEVLYGEAERELTKAVIAYSLRQYELGRRKQFYDHIEGNYELVDMAIKTGDSHTT
ncbi:RNA-directed DNA polymerase [Halobellus rubicundus]|uniref:Reverse transcriptase domain-containing protein n=1 Tax=Halobellus rubicundus TaxID=2996466 RepID=A0ABD5MEV5_9EURY